MRSADAADPGRSGDLAEEIGRLRRACRAEPEQPAHILALARALERAGALEQAAVWHRRAVRLAPGDAAVQLGWGRMLILLGRAAMAVTAFERALQQLPARTELLAGLADALARAGRRDEARFARRRAWTARLRSWVGGARPEAAALHQDPRYAAAEKAYRAGDRAGALALCRELLAQDPDHAAGLNLAAAALAERNEPEEAFALASRAVALEPYWPDFWITLGACERLRIRVREAVGHYQRAIELDPGLVRAYTSVAGTFVELEQFADAEEVARRAVEIDPADATAHEKLARALLGLELAGEAVTAAERGIAACGRTTGLLLALGQSLRADNRFTEARRVLQEAVAAEPKSSAAQLTLGTFLFYTERDLTGAAQRYEAARRLDAAETGGGFNLALMRLSGGDYSRETWELYELRRRQPKHSEVFRRMPFREWDGNERPSAGLLVYGEQGVGDELMFASLVPEAARRAGRCALACDPKLGALLTRSLPGTEVIPWSRKELTEESPALGAYEVAIPSGSLGRFLRTSPESFAAQRPHLVADPERVREWRVRLAAIGPAPYVGVSWRGGIYSTGRTRRSFGPAMLAEALAGSGASWVSLQRDAGPAELETARFAGQGRLTHLPELFADIDSTAALVAALDAVVTACSWVAHLGGGLGRPTFVVAPFVPDWRYGLHGSSMPWYGSVRMCRQERYGEWRPALRALSDSFGEWLSRPEHERR